MTGINPSKAITVALFVALATTGALSAEATTRYVSEDGSNSVKLRLFGGSSAWYFTFPNHCKDRVQPCLTIEYAIRQSANRDRIHVAEGTYYQEARVFAHGNSNNPDRKNLVIAGSYTKDFKKRYSSRTTHFVGFIVLRAEYGGEIDITFEQVTFERPNPGTQAVIWVEAGRSYDILWPYRPYSFLEALGRAGTVRVALRNCGIFGDGAPAVSAAAERFSLVEINLIDATVRNANGDSSHNSIQARTFALKGEFSLLKLNIRDTEVAPCGGATDYNDACLMVWADGGMVAAEVERSSFSNSSNDGINAFSIGDGTLSLHIENSLLSDNRAAGIYAGGHRTDVTLLNDTISGNEGPGIEAKFGSFVEVTNSIVWGNGEDSPDISIGREGTVAARFSDVGDVDLGYTGPDTNPGAFTDAGGNLDEDPGFYGWPDRKLRTDSPLIDRGLCDEYGGRVRVAPEDDFEGQPRPMGDGCDIGWDEAR